MQTKLKKIKFKIIAHHFWTLFTIAFLLLGNFPQAVILGFFPKAPIEIKAPKANAATYQFFATAGTVETGTERNVTSATAAATGGVNLGSYQGLLANDSFHWEVDSTAGGYSMITTLGGATLNGANTLAVVIDLELDATIPQTAFQICDWVSTTSVDNAADANCTGGGWRTINTQNASNADILFNTASPLAVRYNLYDGYFSTGSTGGTPISTPLVNFVNGSNQIKIRCYSTTSSAGSVVSIDYITVFAYIDSVYMASSFTDQTTGGATVAGTYVNTNPLVNSTTTITSAGTSDAIKQVVSTVSSKTLDFYNSYTNVRQYTGMNTILLNTQLLCGSATTIRPYLYNFTDSTWDAIGSVITCATADTSYTISHNTTSDAGFVLNDFISDGEIRVRWATTGAVTSNNISIDWQYVTLGSVNTDSSLCEISFGTGTATNCTNTRSIDTNASATTFDITAEDESGTMGTTEAASFYPSDTDQDVNTEEASSANISFPITVPTNAQVVAVNWASRATGRSAGSTMTMINSVRDYSGLTSVTGGWTDVGASISTVAYQDTVSQAGVLIWGLHTNPNDYVNTSSGLMNMRLRTNAAGATADNNVNTWDFAMMSIQWVDDSYNPTVIHKFTPTSGNLVLGTAVNATSIAAAAANGINTGSWKGTMADDNWHWEITGTTTGVDIQLRVDGVKLNGANKIIIQSEFDLDATAPTTLVQVCDWISSTSVDHAADAQCTGGGWRTLNSRDAVISTATATAYTWYVYDGKWSNGSNTPISTPLTNFVTTDSNKRILVRYYSTTNATTANNFAIDYLRIFPIIGPVYEPADVTDSSGNGLTNDYNNINTLFQGAADNTDLQCLGTSGGPDCYLSFKNVKTYPSMNAILARTEFSCSATNEMKLALRNFSTSTWDDITQEIAGCTTTDTVRIGAKTGITVSDYISDGEVRLRYYRSSGADTGRVDIDYAYIMLGTVNSVNDSDHCFISFGSLSAGDCTNTRNIEIGTGAANSTWNILTEDESTNRGVGAANDYYAFDMDNDVNVEEGAGTHIKFDISGEPSYGPIVGLFSAGNIMSGTAGSVLMGVADYSGYNAASATAGGFYTIGSTSTTALTYSDNVTVGTVASGGAAGFLTNPEDLIQTIGNEAWIRLRTSGDGATSSNSVNQWDFAMISIAWVEPEDQTISFSISDTTIGFGPLTIANARYATGDLSGSDTEVEAHTLTASTSSAAGYTITVGGSTLTSGGNTITALGATNTASSPGTEQFGIRSTVSGISPYHDVDDTYSESGFGYDGTSTPDVFASQSQGDNFESTYSVRYLANQATGTETGTYSTDLTYIMTSNF